MSTTNTCDFCEEMNTVEYMLFQAVCVKCICDLLFNFVNNEFSVTFLIFGDNDLALHWIISILEYVIFKKWIIKTK